LGRSPASFLGERILEIRKIGDVQFVKFDARTGEFVGVMTSETPDDDREIMDLEQSRPYFEDWSEACHKLSDGKSFGNVREMHGLSAAGKLTRPLTFDMKQKRILVQGVIVDPVAKRKAEEGVYIGLSIGGRYVDRFPDPEMPGCMRYVADPTEVSLVDSPNNPDAVMELVGPTGASKLIKMSSAGALVAETLDEPEGHDADLLKAAGLVVARRVLGLASLSKDAKTKRVGGKDLSSSAFAYVGDAADPATWKYPIHDA